MLLTAGVMSEHTDFKGALVGFCNPLLDISGHVSHEFLTEHNLLPNNAILAGLEHENLPNDLMAACKSVFFSAGGAGQNSMRAAQWLLPPSTVVYMGAVGMDDENGRRLRAAAEADGLTVLYQQIDDAQTGTCVCLLTPGNRSLVASLNAASHFNLQHVIDNMDSIKAAKAFYLSGFLLTNCPDLLEFVGMHARDHQKACYMNISAPFLCEFFFEPLLKVLPNVSVLFGNEAEARAFAKAANFQSTEDIEMIAKEMSTFQTDKPRSIVITQGSHSTIVCHENLISQYPVPMMVADEIIDTNGAGDAFVGAFISQHILGRSLSDCVHAGHTVAQIIIRQSGVVFPNHLRPQF